MAPKSSARSARSGGSPTGGTVIIDFNDSFTYNVYELLRKCGCRNFSVKGIAGLDADSFAASESAPERIILSPGPGVPSDYPEVFRLLEQLYPCKSAAPCDAAALREAEASRIPLLGICLGHQIISSFFGAGLYNLEGVVHGQPREIGITEKSSLFERIPSRFTVGLYHSWAVSAELPEPLKLTAAADAGTVMAVEHKSLPVFGVQFHPESCISEYGEQLLYNFLKI